MHLVIPTHLSLFWVVCHPNRTFPPPPKSLSGNPRIGSPLSPLPDHTLSYLWPVTHHSYIGWIHVGGAWALCMLHFRVCRKFVCCSCVYHGLEARLCVLLLILELLWRESISWSFILYGLLHLRVGPCLIMGFSLLNPLFAHSVELLAFLPYHSVIPTMVLFDPCLLGLFWAWCMLFFI